MVGFVTGEFLLCFLYHLELKRNVVVEYGS
jgi:hypothetical protein